MVRKEAYSVLVLGMLLISLALLSINQSFRGEVPAISLNFGAQPAEALSCPARWHDMGGLPVGQSRNRPDEAIFTDQARWDARGGFYASQAFAALSCPALWDAEGGFFAIETGSQTGEAAAKNHAPWASSEASYLRL